MTLKTLETTLDDHLTLETTLDDHLATEMRALRIWMMSAGNILRPVPAQGPRLGAPAPLEIIDSHPMLKRTLADRITAKLRALRIWMIDVIHNHNILTQLLVQEPRLAAPGPPAADDDRPMLKETLAERISLKMRALRIWMSDKHHDRNILSPLLAQEPRLMGPARPEISNDQFLIAKPLDDQVILREALDEHITPTMTLDGHITLAMTPKHRQEAMPVTSHNFLQ